jgi:hypothetical protein
VLTSGAGGKNSNACTPASLRGSLVQNHVGERWPISRGSSVPLHVRTAGSWPNAPEKAAPMACNAYSTVRSGMQTWCAMSLSCLHLRTPGRSARRPGDRRARVARKRGKKSAGVARQATWKIGRRGVFLAYASPKGHTLAGPGTLSSHALDQRSPALEGGQGFPTPCASRPNASRPGR